MPNGVKQIKEALANLRKATLAKEPDKSPELWRQWEDILVNAEQKLKQIAEAKQGYV